MKGTIFFDIDTQYNFMHRTGKFYVKDAEKIIPNLKKITDFAKKKNISIIASVDKHSKHGIKKIPETMLRNATKIPDKKLDDKKIKKLKEKNILLIEKQKRDIFSNPNLKLILNGTKEAYVYGVATDYCVKVAVLGLIKMDIETYVIKDAIKPAFRKNENKVLDLFRKKGAKFLTTYWLLKKKLI